MTVINQDEKTTSNLTSRAAVDISIGNRYIDMTSGGNALLLALGLHEYKLIYDLSEHCPAYTCVNIQNPISKLPPIEKIAYNIGK